MKKGISSGHMMLSLAMGYAVIINLIATSRYEFYPINFVIGAAFAVGIAMVIGTVAFFMGEPKPLNLKLAWPTLSRSPARRPLATGPGGLRTARRVPAAVPA